MGGIKSLGNYIKNIVMEEKFFCSQLLLGGVVLAKVRN